MKENNKHTKLCWPNSVQYDLIWGREQLSNPLSTDLTKWLQNGLQEIGTKAHNEQNLNLPIFPKLTKW